jgi:hypothetical protein
MIYPKRKRVIKAGSGLNTEQIQSVNNQVVEGTKSIPVVGQAISAGLSIGSTIGEGIAGDGSNTGRQVLGDLLNPFSSVNSLMSGRFKEAIPIVGSVFAAQRKQKEMARQKKKELDAQNQKLSEESNKAFSTLTFKKGGSLPKVSDKAVLLGGKTHRDGGNAVLDAKTGEKVAETEREELLFTKKQTESIEFHIKEYEKTSDISHLLELGKFIQEIVMKDMVDYSKQY